MRARCLAVLFGLIRQAGESIRADIREWMGTEYFAAAAISGVGLFIEEMTNEIMVQALDLHGWKETAYRALHRLAFSAMYYFGIKSLFNKPAAALTASVMPVAMIFIDAMRRFIGSEQEAAARLVARFKRTAYASASAPVVVSTVEEAPVSVTVTESSTSTSSTSNVVMPDVAVAV